MKVEEAKMKICPFIQETDIEDFNNGFMYSTRNINCICGDCMAFKYTKLKGQKEHGSGTNVHYVDYELEENEKEGYCKRLGE